MKRYDIVVVGGGFSGIAAAIAAAREKKKVLLIEQAGGLGGAANNCLVMPFMPYSTCMKNPDGTADNVDLVSGIFHTIVERLEKTGQFVNRDFNVEYLKPLLDEMLEEYDVEVLFHATLINVKKAEKRIIAVDISTVAGIMSFEADCFVDATGDANLAALSGCQFQLGRSEDNLCQPMTLCFRVSNVSWDELKNQLPIIQKEYKRRCAQGTISNPREDILLFKTLSYNVVHFNSTRIVKLNPIDPFDLSRAEKDARKQMLELFNFLKSDFPVFKDADLISSGASIGVRESRMVIGEHILTGQELIATLKFEDAVAAGNYDIDIHNPEGSGTSHYYFPAGQYYTIPYRSLVAKDCENLLIAGRCISCDHGAQASIRIMPICSATGEAAGVAAAIACEKQCAARNVDCRILRKILKENGAFC